MKVEKRKLAELRPYWRNPRVHQIEAVKKSIKRYGFNVPIVIDKENQIVAGHARWKALGELGHDEADCVIVDLPPEKVKEYRLVDNKVGEFSEWHIENLIQEMKELEIPNLEPFWGEKELEKLLDETVKAEIPGIEDIASKQEEMEEHFEDLSKVGGERRVDVICPYCGETFQIEKKDIE